MLLNEMYNFKFLNGIAYTPFLDIMGASKSVVATSVIIIINT